VHNHLEKRNGGDTNILEIVRIFLPQLPIVDFLLLLGRIIVECITSWVDELDGVLELCGLLLANDFVSGNRHVFSDAYPSFGEQNPFWRVVHSLRYTSLLELENTTSC
jgi:hypothetical protein